MEQEKQEKRTKTNRPPDGGWGWVVVFASFMCNFIVDGIATSFGVILAPIIGSFDSNRSTVSWIGSLLIGVYNLSGPIVSLLVKRFGHRAVSITGAIVSCIALLLSTLSTNIFVLMIVYGVIGGFGFGMIYLPAVVIVGDYFDSKRSLATGIAVCGSGIGSFVLPPLANHILSYFGSWTSVILTFAVMSLSCTVFGCLMKPLDLAVDKEEEEEDPSPIIKNDKKKSESFKDEKETFLVSNNPVDDNVKNSKSMFNWKLLTNPIMILICLCYGMGNLGMFVPYFFLPNMANLRGITKENSDILLSVIGISNTIGRVIVGYISDFKWVNAVVVTNLSLVFCGISVMVMPECGSFEQYVALAVAFGFFVSAFVSLQTIVVVDLFGLENLTEVFGFLKLFIGISCVIGTPFAGFLYDQTQTYNIPFYVAGGVLVFSSIFTSIAYCRQKTTKERKEKNLEIAMIS